MAKRKSAANGKGPNKSEAIRQAIAAAPKAGVKELVATLAANGLKVQPSLVYMVRSKLGRRRRRAKRESATATLRQAGAANPVALIVKVKALASEVGGLRGLKALVDALAE